MTAIAPPADATAALARVFRDRYAIERELGRGGMGAVYLARDLKLDRPVALKVLPAEYAAQPALRDRFARETRTAASFSHPNIVPVYAVEDSDELLAYAMGFVEGETLTDRVRRAGPLPARELVRLLQDVGYALAYAHGRGVVHRDIKPDNVMLERATGRALVMDFGISRSIAADTSAAAGLTRVGEVVGTPEYMSPEQASGDTVDGRSDLYSLGLVAHFAATGRVAMTGETTQKILVRQLTEPVPSVAEARGDLPPALTAAIDRCVAKEPGDRFATAEALVEAIDAAQLTEPEVPLAIRLLAGDLGTLSMLAVFMSVLGYVFLQYARSTDLADVDTMLPLMMLVAIFITRTLTTLSEARRIVHAGFGVSEIVAGLRRVTDERAVRREELRADPAVRVRRRATLWWAVGMLVGSLAANGVAMAARTQIGPRTWHVPLWAQMLVMAAMPLFATSLVLLLRSPFRMPVGERFFRLIWLGPVGRGFVRWAARGVRPGVGGAARRLSSATHEVVAKRAAVAAPVNALASAHASVPPNDRLGALEARVAELERWRSRA